MNNNLQEYDREMEERTDQLGKINENYKKVAEELNIVQALFDGILDQKMRKEAEEAKIREREEKREAEMKRLHKASEWI